MTLSDSKSFIAKILKPGFIFLIPVFLSCETSEDLGVQYELDDDANVKYKEFTLPATNIYIDSLRTDSENSVLVGIYQDDLVGSVRAEGYVSLRFLKSNIPDNKIESDFIYDSVRISMVANNSAPINRGGTQSFQVHLLNDTLLNLVYLSNKNEVLGNTAGTFSTQVSAEDDTLYFNFRLEDEFGQLLFNSGKDDSLELSDKVDWPSMAFSPSVESSLISELEINNDTSRVFLYVTDPDGIEEISDTDTIYRDTSYVAEFSYSSVHYTNLIRDRSTGNFRGIVENEDFELSDGSSVIDPIAGITTSFSISELGDFFEQNKNILINSGTLSFSYQKEDHRDTLKNAYAFYYEGNSYYAPGLVSNQFTSLIMSDVAFQRGQDVPALSFESDGELNLTATRFFQVLLDNYIKYGSLVFERAEDDSFPLEKFILLSRINVTLERTIIPKDGVKLRLYYTETDK